VPSLGATAAAWMDFSGVGLSDNNRKAKSYCIKKVANNLPRAPSIGKAVQRVGGVLATGGKGGNE